MERHTRKRIEWMPLPALSELFLAPFAVMDVEAISSDAAGVLTGAQLVEKLRGSASGVAQVLTCLLLVVYF